LTGRNPYFSKSYPQTVTGGIAVCSDGVPFHSVINKWNGTPGLASLSRLDPVGANRTVLRRTVAGSITDKYFDPKIIADKRFAVYFVNLLIKSQKERSIMRIEDAHA
jgi:hypothetical protein